jgi:DUF4097 and DUF4098 domain-containing protein YvlB
METTTYPTPRGVALDLRVPAGTIELDLEEAATATVLQIEGERDPGDLRIRFTEGVGEGPARLEVEHRKSILARELRVRVSAPSSAAVDVQTGSADLTVRGAAGSVALRSGSGDLRVDRVEGALTVQTASGDVEAEEVTGACRVAASSGDLRIGRAAGTLGFRSASGDLEAGSADGDVEVSTTSGDVELGAVASGEVRINSVSGDVRIGVVPGIGVWMDIGSVSGDVRSDLPGGEGNRDGADVRLKVSTVSGDVWLRRVG